MLLYLACIIFIIIVLCYNVDGYYLCDGKLIKMTRSGLCAVRLESGKEIKTGRILCNVIYSDNSIGIISGRSIHWSNKNKWVKQGV
jgi:hypothetical protein